jgi:hypothetical protein
VDVVETSLFHELMSEYAGMSPDVSAMFCPIFLAAFLLRSIVFSVSSSAIVCQMFLHTSFFCITRVRRSHSLLYHHHFAHIRTRTRAPHIHPFPRAYLCICNSSPFLHIRQLRLSSPAVRSRYPRTRRAIAISLIAKQSTFFFSFFYFFFLYTSA